jgi:hypothetical protein
MTPRKVPLWCLITLSKPSIEHFVGKPGSDQAFAFRLRCALNPPYKFAKTPEEKKRMKTECAKAVRMIAKAALSNDEEFFARWARGRKALKAIDPRTSLAPQIFILAAYSLCTAGGRQTTQSEVIRLATDLAAAARIIGSPNRVPFPSQKPTREQLDAAIKQWGLKRLGWKAYIRKLGLSFPHKAKRGRKPGWRKK